MVATEAAALYERILSLVPKDELSGGYNDVLREGISSVNRAVNDVSAAFAKLEEVLVAVTKLSNGAAIGRSESLVQAIDKTAELQRNLKRKLKSILADMATGLTSNKRKKGESGDGVPTHSEDNAASMQPLQSIGHVLVRLDAVTDKSSMDTPNFSKKNCMVMVLRLTRLSVEERNRHVPVMLPALVEVLPKITLNKAIMTMKYLILWAHLGSQGEHLLAAYRNFSEALSPWINQERHPKRALGLRRLNETLVDVVERRNLRENQEKRDHVRLSYDLFAILLDAMVPEERMIQIPQLLNALKEEMASQTASDKQAVEITKALKVVVKWAQHDPRDSELLQLYGQLVEVSKSYAGSISSFMIRTDLLGVVRKIEGTLRDLFKTTVQERAATALEWARQLSEEGVSLEHVDKGVMLLDEVIRHKQPDWKPRQNDVVLECYDLLKEHAQLLEAGVVRGQRMAVIAKWRLCRRMRGKDEEDHGDQSEGD